MRTVCVCNLTNESINSLTARIDENRKTNGDKQIDREATHPF